MINNKEDSHCQIETELSHSCSLRPQPLVQDLLTRRRRGPRIAAPARTPRRWTVQQTNRFFHCLGLLGTQFNMAARLFENKTKKQLLNKFKRELKVNRARVEQALRKSRQVCQLSRLQSRRKQSWGSVQSGQVQLAMAVEKLAT